MDRHFTDRHFTDRYLIGRQLMDKHLIGRHLMDRHLIDKTSRTGTSNRYFKDIYLVGTIRAHHNTPPHATQQPAGQVAYL
jgi:hypothetical protein